MSHTPATAPVLLKVEQAADYLNCSLSLTWRLIWSGQLPHIRLGRVVRVPRKALEVWIENSQTVQPAPVTRSRIGD